jgi:hypothetical protein
MTIRKKVFIFVIPLVSLCLIGSSPEPTIVFDKTDPYEQNFLEQEGFHWIETSSPHFLIFYEKGSLAEQRLVHLKQEAEAAIERALGILGEPSYNRGIRLLMLGSRDRMKDLIGQRYKGFAPIGHSVILLVFNEETRPYLRHEIMHKVSIDLWGEPEAWLREGSGMYADRQCLSYPNPLDTITAYLLDKKMIHPMCELMSRFDELTRENDMITYLQSGSFVQFLYENYTKDQIKTLWQQGRSGIPGIFGKSLDALEADWLDHLESVEMDEVKVDWEELLEKGCG